MVRSGMAVNIVFLALLIACSAYVFVKGGGPERVGMAIYVAGAALTYLTYLAVSAPSSVFRGVEVGVLIPDVVTFLAFILLALRANRFWPLWVSALLGVPVVGHVARLLAPQVIPWAYAVVLSIWSYPILLVMVGATWTHQRRLTRNGADPSWTRSSAPLGPRTRPPGPKP